MHRLSYGLMLGFVFSACQTSPPTDPQSVRRIIEARNTDIERWYAAGEIDSLVEAFAQDVWQMPPNSPPLVGRDSVRAYWTNAVKWGRWEFDLQTEEVVPSGTLAAERGRYRLTFTAAAAAPMPSFQDHGNYVALWRQDPDAQWRVVWDAPVSTLPLPGAAGK